MKKYHLLLLVLLCLARPASGNNPKKRRKGRPGNHKSAGIKASKAGDKALAITHFRKHCVLNPIDASGFNNLGVALMRQGIEMDDIRLLKQAEQSFRTSVDISGATSPSTSKNLRWIEEYLTDCDAITSTTPPKIEQNDRDTPLEDTVRELAAMQVRILELMTNMQKTSSAAALD
jgi:hypothetical protein